MKAFRISCWITALATLVACTCRYVDCEGDGFKNIYFTSGADSTDLFSSHKFTPDSLRITPLLIDPNGNSPYWHFDPAVGSGLYLECNENTRGYILQLDSLPADTLRFELSRTPISKCCGGNTVIEKLWLNGILQPNGPYDYDLRIWK